MSKILKNLTASPIEIYSVGITLPAYTAVTINVEDYILFATPESITELTLFINLAQIQVNDGTNDLTPTSGINYLKYPDKAKNIRFDNSNNGFVATDIQGALEEAKQGGSENFSYKRIIAGNEVIIPVNQEMLVSQEFFMEDTGEITLEGDIVIFDIKE